MKQEKKRLCIDFPNAEALLEFVAQAKASGVIEARAEPCLFDGLDMLGDSGITRSNTVVLRDPARSGRRPLKVA